MMEDFIESDFALRSGPEPGSPSEVCCLEECRRYDNRLAYFLFLTVTAAAEWRTKYSTLNAERGLTCEACYQIW